MFEPVSRPVLARVLPFALYMTMLAVEQGLGGAVGDLRWLYPLKIALVAAAFWYFRNDYLELRQPPAGVLPALAAGCLVFILWINLDQGWLDLGGGPGFDPRGSDGAPNWPLLAFRLAGAVLVVPVMEELFWRAFLMRWIERQDFLAVAPAVVGLRAVLVSSLLFGVEHSLWFAGILAGLAYAWLYRHYENLWAPIAAHAATNLILGLWVVATGAWQFW